MADPVLSPYAGICERIILLSCNVYVTNYFQWPITDYHYDHHNTWSTSSLTDVSRFSRGSAARILKNIKKKPRTFLQKSFHEGQTKEHVKLLDGNFCIISIHKRVGAQTADLLHQGFGASFLVMLLLWEQLEQVLLFFFKLKFLSLK